jgi:hypothetical protein
MPLEQACEKYIKSLVFVLPVEGFGWNKIVPNSRERSSGEPIEPPEPFRVRMSEFHYYNGMIQAGVGVVESRGHPLDKMWFAFCLRDRGRDIYNLTTKIGKYNLGISEAKPTIKIEPDNLAIPEWIQFGDSPYLSGLGHISESEISLDEVFSQMKANLADHSG